eukprot:gene3453-4701_t
MLQDSVHRFLQESGGLERTRVFAAQGESRAADVADGLAQLGVTGLLIGEEHGGSGLSLLDAALTSEVMGRHVAPTAFIGTSVMAPLALQRGGSWTKAHTRFIRIVLKKLEKRDTEVIYLRGNHDDILASFLPLDFENLRI